jgi:hypothetical protein
MSSNKNSPLNSKILSHFRFVIQIGNSWMSFCCAIYKIWWAVILWYCNCWQWLNFISNVYTYKSNTLNQNIEVRKKKKKVVKYVHILCVYANIVVKSLNSSSKRIILAYFVRNESVSYYYLILEIPLERWFRIVFKMSPFSRTRTSNMFGHSLIFIYLMILVVLCIGLCSSDELPGNNLNRKDEVRSVLRS